MTTLADLKDPIKRGEFVQSIVEDHRDDVQRPRQAVRLGANSGFEVSQAGLDLWGEGALSHDERTRKEIMHAIMD